MNIVKILSCFTIILVFFSSALAQQAIPLQPAKTPEAALREFYEWYIHANFHGIDPFKGKGRQALKKYVTVRFLREIDRNENLPPESPSAFNADYFLQTQDPLPDPSSDYKEGQWLKSISVSQVSVKGTTATAIVIFLDGYPRVRVSLIKEAGNWKINRVVNKPK